MSNRVSPEHGLEMTDQREPTKDSSHLFQLPQQRQQQGDEELDNNQDYVIHTAGDADDADGGLQPGQDEYLRAVTPADTLDQYEPVVTLPEEAETVADGKSDERVMHVNPVHGTSSPERHQSPLPAENNAPESAVTAPVTVVQGRYLPPLASHPGEDLDPDPRVADESSATTKFTATTDTTTVALSAGELDSGEQLTNFASSSSQLDEGTRAADYSQSTPSAAALAWPSSQRDYDSEIQRAPHQDSSESDTYYHHHHHHQQQQQQQKEQQQLKATTLRERQMNRTNVEMSTANSRPNSAKRESEVIGGERVFFFTIVLNKPKFVCKIMIYKLLSLICNFVLRYVSK